MNESVGNYMQEGKTKAVKALVSLAGALVYIAGIIYAEVHGYALLSRGVDPEFLLWATVGIIALGITALFLPLGLHYSFHDTMQRIAAFGFYAVDLALLIFNAVLDYSFNTGAELPGWLVMYLTFVLPATPIIAACGWSLLALLDPAQKETGMLESLKASTRQALALRVSEAAKNANINDQVDAAAQEVARNVILQTLGATAATTRRVTSLPANTVEGAFSEAPTRQPRKIYSWNNPARRTQYQAAAGNSLDPTQPGGAARRES